MFRLEDIALSDASWKEAAGNIYLVDKPGDEAAVMLAEPGISLGVRSLPTLALFACMPTCISRHDYALMKLASLMANIQQLQDPDEASLDVLDDLLNGFGGRLFDKVMFPSWNLCLYWLCAPSMTCTLLSGGLGL